MSTPRIILSIFAFLFLLATGAGVGAYFWFQGKKTQLREDGLKLEAEAKAFATGKPASACMAEGIARLRRSGGFMESVRAKVFTRACLAASEIPEDFCTGVPPLGEIMKSAMWALERCEQLGMPGDQPCARFVQVVQEHCHPSP